MGSKAYLGIFLAFAWSLLVCEGSKPAMCQFSGFELSEVETNEAMGVVQKILDDTTTVSVGEAFSTLGSFAVVGQQALEFVEKGTQMVDMHDAFTQLSASVPEITEAAMKDITKANGKQWQELEKKARQAINLWNRAKKKFAVSNSMKDIPTMKIEHLPEKPSLDEVKKVVTQFQGHKKTFDSHATKLATNYKNMQLRSGMFAVLSTARSVMSLRAAYSSLQEHESASKQWAVNMQKWEKMLKDNRQEMVSIIEDFCKRGEWDIASLSWLASDVNKLHGSISSFVQELGEEKKKVVSNQGHAVARGVGDSISFGTSLFQGISSPVGALASIPAIVLYGASVFFSASTYMVSNKDLALLQEALDRGAALLKEAQNQVNALAKGERSIRRKKHIALAAGEL